MLDEAASLNGGQVFALDSGDLALLCGDAAADLLPALLRRLLHREADSLQETVVCWTLPANTAAAIAYAESQCPSAAEARTGVAPASQSTRTSPDPPYPPDAPGRETRRVERLATAAHSREPDLLQRQTAIVLVGGDGEGHVRPLFREVSFSIAALEGRAGPGQAARPDPYLFRHLAGRLDRRMIALVGEALGRSGPLDPCRAGAPRLHLNMTLATIGDEALGSLAGRIAAAGGSLGVELALLEAVADPAAMRTAAKRLDALGCALVIDAVPAAALTLADLTALPPALVKVDWAPHLPRLGAAEAERLDAAIHRLSPARIVLQRADGEPAIRWGLARRIRRFQGRHVDAMLAASRLAACTHAGGCTLRQCKERHAAIGAAPRAACRDHGLLDAAAPEPAGPHRVRTRPRAAA